MTANPGGGDYVPDIPWRQRELQPIPHRDVYLSVVVDDWMHNRSSERVSQIQSALARAVAHFESMPVEVEWDTLRFDVKTNPLKPGSWIYAWSAKAKDA